MNNKAINKLRRKWGSFNSAYKYKSPNIKKIRAGDIKDIKINGYSSSAFMMIELLINKGGAEWTITIWEFDVQATFDGITIMPGTNISRLWDKLKNGALAGKLFGLMLGDGN